MKKTAFTLAEILIVITTIGFTVALAMPSVMNSIQDKRLAVQAKKAHSTIQDAVQAKYFRTQKTPESSGTTLGEFLLGTSDDAGVISVVASNSNGTFELPDGQVVFSIGDCTADGCTVAVDLNGVNMPNAFGVDTTKTVAKTGQQVSAFSGSYTTSFTPSRKDIIFLKIEGLDVHPHPNDYHAKKYILGVD